MPLDDFECLVERIQFHMNMMKEKMKLMQMDMNHMDSKLKELKAKNNLPEGDF